MKTTLCKTATFALTIAILVCQCLAATPKPANLVIGTGPIATAPTGTDWAGYSALTLIPASSVLPVSSTTTVFYLAFTGPGTGTVDISNMVVYKMSGPSSTKVSTVTPVKLGGTSSPSIVLTNPSVCPVQPVSVTNPCFVRLDATTLSLSSATDYWLVVYFANDANNSTVLAATNQFANPSLSGAYDVNDDTQLTAGQSLPALTNQGLAYFLVAVMNN